MKSTKTLAFLMFNSFLLGLGGTATAEDQKWPAVIEVCNVELGKVVEGHCLEDVKVTVTRRAEYSDLPEASYQCEVMVDGRWEAANSFFTFRCLDTVGVVSVRYTYTPDRRQRAPMPSSAVRPTTFTFVKATPEFKTFCDASTSVSTDCRPGQEVKFEYPVTISKTNVGEGFSFTCEASSTDGVWISRQDDDTVKFRGCPVTARLRACPPNEKTNCYEVTSSVETGGAFVAAGARKVEREIRTTTKYIPPDSNVVKEVVKDLIRHGEFATAAGPTEEEKKHNDEQDEQLAILQNQMTEHGLAGPIRPEEKPVTQSQLDDRLASLQITVAEVERVVGALGERGLRGPPGKVGTNTYYLGGGVGFNNTGLQPSWNRTERNLVAPLEIGLVWPLPFRDGNLGLCPEFNFGYAGKVPAGVKELMVGGKGSLCYFGSDWFFRAGVQYFSAGPGFLNNSVVAGNQFLGGVGSVHYRIAEWFAAGGGLSFGRCLAPEGTCGGPTAGVLFMR